MPIQRSPMRSKNPRRIAALIMVDVSPRWVTGCTIVEPRRNLDEESAAVLSARWRAWPSGSAVSRAMSKNSTCRSYRSRVAHWIGWTYLTCVESGLHCVGCMAGIVCASLFAGFAQNGYESFRCVMPSSGRLAKSRLGLWRQHCSCVCTFHPGSWPTSGPDPSLEYPLECDAAFERAVYSGRDA